MESSRNEVFLAVTDVIDDNDMLGNEFFQRQKGETQGMGETNV